MWREGSFTNAPQSPPPEATHKETGADDLGFFVAARHETKERKAFFPMAAVQWWSCWYFKPNNSTVQCAQVLASVLVVN